jgi:hypothetical protein
LPKYDKTQCNLNIEDQDSDDVKTRIVSCSLFIINKLINNQLFVHVKKAYDSVRKEVLYNVLMESGTHMKPVTKLCLNETYSRVRIGKDRLTCLLLRMF